MIIIPAVDIMDHRVVQLVGGVPGSETIVFPDPLEKAMDWVRKGAPYLHIIDLDGAFGKEDNMFIIKSIIQECGVPVEVGGGIRSHEKISELVDAGADRIILGTRAVADLNWLEKMCDEFPNKILLALDTKGSEITVKGWQENSGIPLDEMFSYIKDLDLAGVLNTNVDVEGQGKGIDRMRSTRFIEQCPHKVISSGGVSTEEDAKILSEAGADGAVVGVAIYTEALRPWEWSTPWKA